MHYEFGQERPSKGKESRSYKWARECKVTDKGTSAHPLAMTIGHVSKSYQNILSKKKKVNEQLKERHRCTNGKSRPKMDWSDEK